MLRWIKDCYNKSMAIFISEVRKEPERQSNGRRRLDNDRIFAETLAQYETGDVFHLNNLTYDPLI